MKSRYIPIWKHLCHKQYSDCNQNNELWIRSLRAHTPRAHCAYMHSDRCYWRPLPTHKRPVCAWAEGCCILIVGTVEGCGYDGQPKYTICDPCRPCHSIRSKVRPVFHHIRQICRAYGSLKCLKCPDQAICRWQQQQNRLLYPCACARGNNKAVFVHRCPHPSLSGRCGGSWRGFYYSASYREREHFFCFLAPNLSSLVPGLKLIEQMLRTSTYGAVVSGWGNHILSIRRCGTLLQAVPQKVLDMVSLYLS